MNNRMLKRILKTFLVFAMIFSFSLNSFAISAHAADQKSRIAKQVNTYMSAVRRYDIKKLKSMQIDKDIFHIRDKYIEKYIRKINRDCLSYEIKRIKVRGSSATVYLHARQHTSQCDFENAMKQVLWEYDKSWSSAKFGKELYEYLIWAYDPEDEVMMYDINIKISMTKKGNKWMINKMNKDMLFLKDGGLIYFMEDFTKHPKKYL